MGKETYIEYSKRILQEYADMISLESEYNCYIQTLVEKDLLERPDFLCKL